MGRGCGEVKKSECKIDLARGLIFYGSCIIIELGMTETAKDKIIEALRGELPYLKREFGVRKIALFGSFAKGLQTSQSDIDIYIEVDEPLELDERLNLSGHLRNALGTKIDVVLHYRLADSSDSSRISRIARSIRESLIYV